MNNAKSTIHGGLYEFLSEAKKRTSHSFTKDSASNFPTTTAKVDEYITPEQHIPQHTANESSYNNESYHKIAPIIPKNFSFIIKAATFSAVKENSQNDFSAKMQLFSVSITRESRTVRYNEKILIISWYIIYFSDNG